MAEKEYIERDAAIADLELYETQVVKNEYALAIAGCRSHIRKLPAADVRPVVMCRDCKHGQGEKMDFWNEYVGIECIGGVVHRKDWFCADGEKMEES